MNQKVGTETMWMVSLVKGECQSLAWNMYYDSGSSYSCKLIRICVYEHVYELNKVKTDKTVAANSNV